MADRQERLEAVVSQVRQVRDERNELHDLVRIVADSDVVGIDDTGYAVHIDAPVWAEVRRAADAGH